MQAWQNFLNAQEKQFGKEIVDKWLRSLKIVHFDSANIYCEAKDSFQVMWFEEHIRPLLKESLFNNNHRPIKVHITASEETVVKTGKRKKDLFLKAPPLILTADPLDQTATLEHFVSGKNNALLFRFFLELVSDQIALGAFNPIYLHGASDTGKTYLLMALAHAFTQKGLSALYVRSETFTEHVVSAIRSSQMDTFRKHYRNIDLLIVDDIHLLARKTATQEEFFHTFNTLHTSGRQIILSANSPPLQLEEIEPRLTSRFEWGITLHLEKLSSLELKQVLCHRSQALTFPLSDEVLNFLVETFSASPKSLNCALDALILRTHLKLDPISLDRKMAEGLLADLIDAEKQIALNDQKIILTVAAFYEISSEELLGKSHAHEYAFPRQIAMYLCRTQLNLPFMKIGQIFSRDHSTVMTSVKQIQSQKAQGDHELIRALTEIQDKLT
jgi:chromosomal replication initiator protein